MRRWKPQFGQTLRLRTNFSRRSVWPHWSHFSQASGGISCFSWRGRRGFFSLRNHAMRGIYRTAANSAAGKAIRSRRLASWVASCSIFGHALARCCDHGFARVSRARASSSAATRLHAASLARSEWRLKFLACHRESLATRGAAYEDALTLLPSRSLTAARRCCTAIPPARKRAELRSAFPYKLPRCDRAHEQKARGRYGSVWEARGVLVGSASR